MKILVDKSQNLYLYIHTDDHTPAHVHVFKGRKNDRNRSNVKINIGNEDEPPSIVKADSDMRHDIKAAWRLVADNQEILLNKWNEIHGVQKLEQSDQRGRTRRSNRKS